ncbi:50S ribosomal protein L23 [Patescibacteria group bacterium]|nr:50S ribosomal protein L23 [Patescibacteria group bacterium]
MALFDRFTKKKSQPKRSERKASAKVAAESKEEKTAAISKSPKKESVNYPIGVLTSHHVTEKSSLGNVLNKYTFRVARRANKIEVKKAVEGKYGVRVVRVNIINAKSKSVRLGRTEGRVPGFKKAIVTLAEGQTIQMQ